MYNGKLQNVTALMALNDACNGISIDNLLQYLLERFGEVRFRKAINKILGE